MKQENIVSKELWGDGPWVGEPLGSKPIVIYDRSYECEYWRHINGHWCGYIKLNTNDYDLAMNNTLDFHGGITFDKENEEGKNRTIGFDCAHIGEDIIPKYPQFSTHRLFNGAKTTYKTLEFCQNETKRFIDELLELKKLERE